MLSTLRGKHLHAQAHEMDFNVYQWIKSQKEDQCTIEVKEKVSKTTGVSVSWVRHRDIHLLTVGRYTYTSDQRFEAMHSPHTEDWTLRIRYPQKKDSGIYECQISTTPPIGHPVYLTVVEEDNDSEVDDVANSDRKSNTEQDGSSDEDIQGNEFTKSLVFLRTDKI
ncbi:hypothetical protein FQA39_LY02483 [Lamprigera yunnana]|nr:hypothetical protein FQA39_LY02483 [Lamprigera yunnana]